ncbi:hypothetical protein I302_103867 [Kwoniella bestiolae CBS 10118]|uniref:Uncharacterized protein n=1 Tax=Kwoniella bestiolae CBS 10118 TaxID=1296100 RepID=A0A1B9G9P1_9TREE|nr:hypothetical protein I302_02572 [Kwoniella bestiolae CBS 10118]OCF27727.1 hypothetical protein I302_02572 [Kwoniella bestiolae CBS 10118]
MRVRAEATSRMRIWTWTQSIPSFTHLLSQLPREKQMGASSGQNGVGRSNTGSKHEPISIDSYSDEEGYHARTSTQTSLCISEWESPSLSLQQICLSNHSSSSSNSLPPPPEPLSPPRRFDRKGKAKAAPSTTLRTSSQTKKRDIDVHGVVERGGNKPAEILEIIDRMISGESQGSKSNGNSGIRSSDITDAVTAFGARPWIEGVRLAKGQASSIVYCPLEKNFERNQLLWYEIFYTFLLSNPVQSNVAFPGIDLISPICFPIWVRTSTAPCGLSIFPPTPVQAITAKKDEKTVVTEYGVKERSKQKKKMPDQQKLLRWDVLNKRLGELASAESPTVALESHFNILRSGLTLRRHRLFPPLLSSIDLQKFERLER